MNLGVQAERSLDRESIRIDRQLGVAAAPDDLRRERPTPQRFDDAQPYGYRLADAGAHPNPAKAADGRRLHILEPHPAYKPVVKRIFADYLSGKGIKAIASELTAEGIASPSAADPARNRHPEHEGRVPRNRPPEIAVGS
jgi:hypothetical protein